MSLDNRYVEQLRGGARDPKHPLYGRAGASWRFSDSWSSRLQSGGFHTHHVHPRGWISSAYYVQLPTDVTAGRGAALEGRAGPGWLCFGVPDIKIPGFDDQPRRSVQPAVGRLVLFPSYSWHGTVPFAGPARGWRSPLT